MRGLLCPKWGDYCVHNDSTVVSKMRGLLCPKWGDCCVQNEKTLCPKWIDFVSKMMGLCVQNDRTLCPKWGDCCVQNEGTVVSKMKRLCVQNEGTVVSKMRGLLCPKWEKKEYLTLICFTFNVLIWIYNFYFPASTRNWNRATCVGRMCLNHQTTLSTIDKIINNHSTCCQYKQQFIEFMEGAGIRKLHHMYSHTSYQPLLANLPSLVSLKTNYPFHYLL